MTVLCVFWCCQACVVVVALLVTSVVSQIFIENELLRCTAAGWRSCGCGWLLLASGHCTFLATSWYIAVKETWLDNIVLVPHSCLTMCTFMVLYPHRCSCSSTDSERIRIDLALSPGSTQLSMLHEKYGSILH